MATGQKSKKTDRHIYFSVDKVDKKANVQTALNNR